VLNILVMSREITLIAIEAEESETARGGFRPSSPGRQRSLQGSFEEWPSGGLSLLAEAAGTFAPLGEPIWNQSTPQVGLGLLHSRSCHTPSGPTQPPTSYQSVSLPPNLPGQLLGTMPSATFDSLTAAQPSYLMPPTSATPLAPVQSSYFMPPAANTYSPQVPHRIHPATMSPTPPAATPQNSSLVPTTRESLVVSETSAFKPISEQTLDLQATVRMTQRLSTIVDDDDEIIVTRPPLLPHQPMASRGLPRLSRSPTPTFNFDWPQARQSPPPTQPNRPSPHTGRQSASSHASHDSAKSEFMLELVTKIQVAQKAQQQLEADTQREREQLDAERQRERERIEAQKQRDRDQLEAEKQLKSQQQLLEEFRRREDQAERREAANRIQAEQREAEARVNGERLAALEVRAALAEFQLQTCLTQSPSVQPYNNTTPAPNTHALDPASVNATTPQSEAAISLGYTEPPTAVLIDTSDLATQSHPRQGNDEASISTSINVPTCTAYLSAPISPAAPITTLRVPSLTTSAETSNTIQPQLSSAEGNSLTGGQSSMTTTSATTTITTATIEAKPATATASDSDSPSAGKRADTSSPQGGLESPTRPLPPQPHLHPLRSPHPFWLPRRR